MLFKNSTLVAVLLGLVLGALLGWLVGNLALGILFAVGVAVGALALFEELAVTPGDLAAGRVRWRDLRGRWRGAPPSEGPSAPTVTPRPGLETRTTEPAVSKARVAEASVPDAKQPDAKLSDAGANRAGVSAPRTSPSARAPGMAPGTAENTGAQQAPTPGLDPAWVQDGPEAKPGEAPFRQAADRSADAAPQRKIVLVAGVGQQLTEKSRARDLYSNPLFALNVQYAESLGPDAIYVLSAKHHLLDLDAEVEPYELFLSTMKADELKSWSDEVLRQLAERADLDEDRFVILAASKYRKHLLGGIRHVELPTEGLSLSEQRDFLKAETDAETGELPRESERAD